MFVTSWKVYDQITTSQLEGKLNVLAAEGFEVHRLEWVLNKHSTEIEVPLVTRMDPVSTYLSNEITKSKAFGLTSDSGYWIIVGIKIDNE